MIKRILVALSGTPYTPSATQHAIELAHRHRAEVTGVTIVDTRRLEDVGPVPMGGGAAAHALAEHRVQITKERVEEVIESFRSACRDAGVAHEVVRETGDVMDELTSHWRYHDLTIFGLRDMFEYGVIDNPDDWIVRLIAKGVRPIIAVSRTYRPVTRALIAYSGSLASAKAMKRFIQMRLWPDVDLKIVCCDRPEGEAATLLADAARYCRSHGFQPETEAIAGSAKTSLLQEAGAWKADLVVMGSMSRSRIAKLVLGETMLEVLQKAEEPLYLAQ